MNSIIMILIGVGMFLVGCSLAYSLIAILEGHGAPVKWRNKKSANTIE